MRCQPSGTSRLLVVVVVAASLTTIVACRRQEAPAPDLGTAAGEITFSRHVAPIVFQKCAPCHRPGDAAPFPLLTYEDVRGRASQIAEVTQRRYMPPWAPHDGFGQFAGPRNLSDQEINTFSRWAAAGMPRGDVADLPAAPAFTDEWQLGPPDLVLDSPTYTLSAVGSDQFRNFVIPVEVDAPRWVAAVELLPTNPRVTHHARIGIDSSYESVRRDAQDDQPGYEGMAWSEDPDGQLVIWAPGMVARRGLVDSAWRLQPKMHLVLHTHLQPSGKEERVQFRIGLHFAADPPTTRPVILRVGSRDIDIPAGESNHVVVNEYELPVSVDVHSIFPHAHSLCKEIRVVAEQTDGTRQPLIWIEHFDEKWHDQYHYATPVRVPRGAKLVTTFVYDNSEANIRNRRSPPERTVFGSNAADEMQDVFLQVTTVHPDERAALLEDFRIQEHKSKLVGFNKTLEAYAQDPWSREGLAGSYLALGNPQEAIRVLEQRLARTPAENHSLAILGMAYAAAGNLSRAEELQRRVLDADPNYPFAWFGLGRVLAAQLKVDQAEKAFGQALQLAPTLVDARLALASVFVEQGKLDQAAAACDEAIRLSPEEPNAHLKLAEIRARQQRFDDSLQRLEEAQRLAPYLHPPKVLLATFCFQNGAADRARKLLADAHAEQPEHPVPPLFLGQLARKEGRLVEARQFLETAAALPIPRNWPASHGERFAALLQAELRQLQPGP